MGDPVGHRPRRADVSRSTAPLDRQGTNYRSRLKNERRNRNERTTNANESKQLGSPLTALGGHTEGD